MPQDFSQLTQLTGVGVAGLSVFLMWKLTTNHLAHLTDAVNKLIKVVESLEEFLKEHSYEKKR